MRALRIFFVLTIGLTAAVPCSASGFDPRIVTFGSERDQIKSMPIEKRPNRPLHVYGNSVRRRNARVTQPTVSSPRR
ncbi:MAG: hypothetical protein RLZZ111_1166 [Planctomycetota bacterium]|jgi:hypothetical protein